MQRTTRVFLIILLAGLCSCTTTRVGMKSVSEALPDELGAEVEMDTDQIEIQVAALDDETASRCVGYPLLRKDVLAVYVRVKNVAPTRLLIRGEDCRLFGKDGEEYVEIPSLSLGEVASSFDQSAFGYVSLIPLGVLSIPIVPLGLEILNSSETNLDRVQLENGLLHESLLRVAWGRRTLGPGAIEKGLLFFDWGEAEEYEDELYLALDMRDLINDWHTVMPISLKINPSP